MIKIFFVLFLALILNFSVIFYKENLIKKEIEIIQQKFAGENFSLEVIEKGPINLYAWNINLLLEVRLQGSFLKNNLYLKLFPIEIHEQLGKIDWLLPKKMTLYFVPSPDIKTKLELEDKYQIDIISDERVQINYKEARELEIQSKALEITSNNNQIQLTDLLFKKSTAEDKWLYLATSNIITPEQEGKFFIEIMKNPGQIFRGKFLLKRGQKEIILEGGNQEKALKKLRLQILLKEHDSLIVGIKDFIKLVAEKPEEALDVFNKILSVIVPLGEKEGDYLKFILEDKDEGLFLQKEPISKIKDRIVVG